MDQRLRLAKAHKSAFECMSVFEPVVEGVDSPLAVESCATWQRLQALDLKAPGTAERPSVA